MAASCKFVKAWIGACGVPCEGDYCEEHAKLKCCSCGGQATGTCDETQGPFVCGAPLCDSCEHELAPNGTNEGNGHVPKGTQRYKIWLEQDEQEKLVGDYLMRKRYIAGIHRIAGLIGGEKGEGYLAEKKPRIEEMQQEIAKLELEHPDLFPREET